MKRGILAFLLVFSLSPLYAKVLVQEYLLDPPEFYVGDQVFLTVRFTMDKEVPLTEPAVLPQTDNFVIDSLIITQKNKEATLLIQFRSFLPGISYLPVLDLGGLRLDGIEIFTSSVTDSQTIDIRPIQAQAYLPGARLAIIGILLILLIVPLIVIFTWRVLVQNLKIFSYSISRKRPFKRFMRCFKKLTLNYPHMDAKDFFISLTDSLKHYLSNRTRYDFSTATTKDILKMSLPFVDDSIRADLIGLLKTSDLVKFAGEFLDNNEKKMALALAEKIVKEMESEEANIALL